jgi:C1A family cysteine protease
MTEEINKESNNDTARTDRLKSMVFNYKWSEETPDSLTKLREHRTYCRVGDIVKTDINALPAVVDLRDNMPPIYDQGALGSCTAQAVGACMYYDQKISNRETVVDPSRLFVYWNSRLPIGTINEDSGASLSDVILSTVTYGACKEELWPYIIGNFRTRPTKACYEDAYNCIDTDGCLQAEVNQNVMEIKSVLASEISMVFGIDVYSSFMSSQVASTGVVPMPNTHREDYYGGHAMVLCGYNDYTQMFVFRNSWGKDWGMEGYGWIPYAYVVSTYLAGDIWSVSGIGSKPLPEEGVIVPDPQFVNSNSIFGSGTGMVIAIGGVVATLIIVGLLLTTWKSQSSRKNRKN